MTTWLPRWLAFLLLVLPFPVVAVEPGDEVRARKAACHHGTLFEIERHLVYVVENDQGQEI